MEKLRRRQITYGRGRLNTIVVMEHKNSGNDASRSRLYIVIILRKMIISLIYVHFFYSLWTLIGTLNTVNTTVRNIVVWS